ncbi:MAG: hypothetical protein AAF789_03360 [Bacteroidota bacterium]
MKGKSLYLQDLEGLVPTEQSKSDSAEFVLKFVDSWVKKQLMIARAESEIDFNKAEIANKVLDYQYALMVHELEKKHIDENLDSYVSEDEISDYYTLKSENFILRKNLIKVLYYKFPIKTAGLYQFKRWLRRYPQDSAKIVEFGTEKATKSFSEVNEWVEFEEIILETPLEQISDKSTYLKRNNFIELSDEENTYLVKIVAYKLVGEVAPIEFVRESIRNVILSKRKITLTKELEKDIYEEAKKTDAITIFNY